MRLSESFMEVLNPLKDICTRAMAVGQKMDLSKCHYGNTSGRCLYIKRPTNYYFFLAGLVRAENLRYILEIGTHFGGSIRSMRKGLNKRHIFSNKLVTVDVTNDNMAGLKGFPRIHKIWGNSLAKKVANRAINCFKKPIDLLYIDSIHEYDHTMANINTYGPKLDPLYIVLDDIRQCDSMRKLWADITIKYGNRAYDASEIAIRKGAGFGIIKWR